MEILNAELVGAVFQDCLLKDSEDNNQDRIEAEGIGKVEFHSGRLESHRAKIEEMLDELPDEFKRELGGGYSFLAACNNKHGQQWTSFHQRMEQLFLLGIGIGKVKALFPRELWPALSGGMPYYVIE